MITVTKINTVEELLNLFFEQNYDNKIERYRSSLLPIMSTLKYIFFKAFSVCVTS